MFFSSNITAIQYGAGQRLLLITYYVVLLSPEIPFSIIVLFNGVSMSFTYCSVFCLEHGYFDKTLIPRFQPLNLVFTCNTYAHMSTDQTQWLLSNTIMLHIFIIHIKGSSASRFLCVYQYQIQVFCLNMNGKCH